jgi:hypothetical protein
VRRRSPLSKVCNARLRRALYINYLRAGDVVALPGYDRPEDRGAVEKMRRELPNYAQSKVAVAPDGS